MANQTHFLTNDLLSALVHPHFIFITADHHETHANYEFLVRPPETAYFLGSFFARTSLRLETASDKTPEYRFLRCRTVIIIKEDAACVDLNTRKIGSSPGQQKK